LQKKKKKELTDEGSLSISAQHDDEHLAHTTTFWPSLLHFIHLHLTRKGISIPPLSLTLKEVHFICCCSHHAPLIFPLASFSQISPYHSHSYIKKSTQKMATTSTRGPMPQAQREECIKVVVRIRPLNEKEKQDGRLV
jgi:hypothetical protein